MGLVLAGGKSSRMGTDKALLRPSGSQGPTLLEKAWSVLRAVTPVCFVSCSPHCQYPGFPCLADSDGPEGPCRGVLNGLRKASELQCAAVVVLACDVPRMESRLLRQLLALHQAAAEKPLATLFMAEKTGRVEMLAGVYSAECLPFLEEGMAKGISSLYWLIPQGRKQIVPYGDALAEFFINCNTPEDLGRIQTAGAR